MTLSELLWSMALAVPLIAVAWSVYEIYFAPEEFILIRTRKVRTVFEGLTLKISASLCRYYFWDRLYTKTLQATRGPSTKFLGLTKQFF